MTTLHLMLAIALCGLGLGFMIIFWFLYRPFAGFGLGCFLGGLSIGTIAILNKRWLTKGKRSLILRVVEIALFAAGAAIFAAAGQLIPALVFAAIGALIGLATAYETRQPVRSKIRIDEKGILLPKGMTTRLISWVEVEELILRHSILSIELSGNRLIQRTIENNHPDASALETFSAEQIRLHARERAENAAW